MPTPLAHGVAGLAVARTVRDDWRAWHFALIAFAITIVPDLDFLPGILVGDPGAYHRGATHSFVGAVLFSAPIAVMLVWLSGRLAGGGSGPASFARWYAFVLPVYASHLVLDLVSPDTVHNSGVRLWWPFSDAYAAAPLPMPVAIRPFFDLEFGPGAADFFATLFSGHAFSVYLVEAALFSPLLLIPLLLSRLRKKSPPERRGPDNPHADRVGRPRRAEPAAALAEKG